MEVTYCSFSCGIEPIISLAITIKEDLDYHGFRIRNINNKVRFSKVNNSKKKNKNLQSMFAELSWNLRQKKFKEIIPSLMTKMFCKLILPKSNLKNHTKNKTKNSVSIVKNITNQLVELIKIVLS